MLDKNRLINGQIFDEDYFDHLLSEIQEIRASKRRFYQKITDIYATAVDYDRDSKLTQNFFATVQNKMHYAVHGGTAAEVIVARADHTKEHMGLTSWRNAPDGKIVNHNDEAILSTDSIRANTHKRRICFRQSSGSIFQFWRGFRFAPERKGNVPSYVNVRLFGATGSSDKHGRR